MSMSVKHAAAFSAWQMVKIQIQITLRKFIYLIVTDEMANLNLTGKYTYKMKVVFGQYLHKHFWINCVYDRLFSATWSVLEMSWDS